MPVNVMTGKNAAYLQRRLQNAERAEELAVECSSGRFELLDLGGQRVEIGGDLHMQREYQKDRAERGNVPMTPTRPLEINRTALTRVLAAPTTATEVVWVEVTAETREASTTTAELLAAPNALLTKLGTAVAATPATLMTEDAAPPTTPVAELTAEETSPPITLVAELTMLGTPDATLNTEEAAPPTKPVAELRIVGDGVKEGDSNERDEGDHDVVVEEAVRKSGSKIKTTSETEWKVGRDHPRDLRRPALNRAKSACGGSRALGSSFSKSFLEQVPAFDRERRADVGVGPAAKLELYIRFQATNSNETSEKMRPAMADAV
ncbi:hypothetical protein DFH09DRAFT_1454458 [Mycena vulgaris]|nr:hypothetical protein DFH09DRAFT_1454458 [Mycena vulgaris]